MRRLIALTLTLAGRKVTEVTTELVRARLLLPDDAARLVDEAARRSPFQP